MSTLVLCEKPKSAQRIAYALSNGSCKRVNKRGAYWFEFSEGNEKIVVAPAVGHLYGLKQDGGGWTYPVFNVKWVETFKNKGGEFARKYYENLRDLSKGVEEVVVGTDYDREGDVIAYNILRFIFGREHAKRMKFSTLTFSELRNAFEHVKPELDMGQVNAGITRHVLDFYWGINASRALMHAVKSAGRYSVLSIGRVQGPALKLLADREKEIRAFTPTPYWQLVLIANGISALYEENKIWDKEKALRILEECKNKNAVVSKVEKQRFKHNPPVPFSLTDLQTEAYALFGLNPSHTLAVAQDLYLAGLISYPRTSSQKLPAKIGYKNIMRKLKGYTKLVDKVPQMERPRAGVKTDPAHPAIYPTGELPSKKSMSGVHAKVYDLIVKRFLSVFGEPASRVGFKITLSIKKYDFIASGAYTVEKNWFELYEPYVRVKECSVPDVREGQSLNVKELKLLEKKTKPPKRYTQGSLIAELEKRNLGTKATRAEIIESLFRRGYVEGREIVVLELGIKVIETLEKHCPDIISEELTRRFEEEMADIASNKKQKEEVIDSARKNLSIILAKFKQEEGSIGEELSNSMSVDEKRKVVGKCPECGSDLYIIKSKKTGKRFIGCTSFSKGCRVSYPLPQKGLIQVTNKVCETCKAPIVKVITRGRKPWHLCVNPNCPSKQSKK